MTREEITAAALEELKDYTAYSRRVGERPMCPSCGETVVRGEEHQHATTCPYLRADVANPIKA